MKTIVSETTGPFEIVALSTEELLQIDGGSFWHDVAWVIGYAGRKVYNAVDSALDSTAGNTSMSSPIGAGPKGASGN
jgi:hypothetical protein